MTIATVLLNPLVAQSGGSTYSASWALVLFCVILGLLVALNPARRTSEIKRAKD
jgi:ABC-type sulfate transport system permease component